MSSNHLNPSGMSSIIGGKRYSVDTSALLADNDTWDGNNFTRSGRNTFLYKTKGGAFFVVTMTCWQNERDTIRALSREDAKDLFENLPEHHVNYETAFDTVIEEASGGRPTYYGEPMTQISVWMPAEMISWLKNQPGPMSETLRALIKSAMDAQRV